MDVTRTESASNRDDSAQSLQDRSGDNEGSAGPGGEFSLGDPLTSSFATFLQDVLKNHA